MNGGQDTSANKTHLFNWLYDMTVQMGRGAGARFLNAYGMFAAFPFIHPGVHACVWGSWCVCVCV